MKSKGPILVTSFIFALAIWIYVSLSQSYSLDLTIPLEIKTGKSQALTEDIPSDIDLTIKGKGWDLLSVLISRDLKYTLDLSKIKKDSKIATEQLIGERLNLKPELSLASVNPDTIDVQFDRILEKTVPIRNNIKVNLREGYGIVGKPKLTPDSIRISGAASIVSRVKFIPTETRIFDEVNNSITGTIALKDTLPNTLKYDIRFVDFRYNIQLSAEKTIEEVVVGVSDVPEDKEVLLIPPKVSVSVRGGVDQLAKIAPSDISATVSFETIEVDTLGFVVPEIAIPDETNLLKSEPQKLQYIIKKKL
jgi:YbbR domain-containing protein